MGLYRDNGKENGNYWVGVEDFVQRSARFSIHPEARHFPGLSRLLMFAAACDTGWSMYRHCVVSGAREGLMGELASAQGRLCMA